MAETAITGNKTKHYIYLDVVRIVAVITSAAHLLGFLETGWAAVCTLLMIAGYAAARNAFANRKYSLWRGLLSAVVRVYMPLAAVAGLVTIAASHFPQILWLSERHETASVFFGINPHAAEFEYLKFFSVFSNSILNKYYWSSITIY